MLNPVICICEQHQFFLCCSINNIIGFMFIITTIILINVCQQLSYEMIYRETGTENLYFDINKKGLLESVGI